MRFIRLQLKILLHTFAFACAVSILFAIITNTYAWLEKTKQRQHVLRTSNFTLVEDVYFLQADNSRVQASNYKDAQTGYYIVNTTNSSALNYGAKLHVDIKYNGTTKAYLRVYINDMWSVSNKSLFKAVTIFTNNSSLWLDNRTFDDYYYYIGGSAEQRGFVYSDVADQEKTYTFITGINDFAKINNGVLYLEIRAEAVQINRIQAFWGISQLPT